MWGRLELFVCDLHPPESAPPGPQGVRTASPAQRSSIYQHIPPPILSVPPARPAIHPLCREHARGIPGKAQLFINAFARALEIIPRQVGGWAGGCIPSCVVWSPELVTRWVGGPHPIVNVS